MTDIHESALVCLQSRDADEKCRLTHALMLESRNHFVIDDRKNTVKPLAIPGYPDSLELVSPRHLKRRRLGTVEGRAALIHALAHIEFNAINLALDAVYRFRNMPTEFYRDWLRVADEESTHFLLLHTHLCSLGYNYGDFPAHDGLWEMAVKTAEDVMARMALVPRCLEARGLDVTPGIQKKLINNGDTVAALILGIILRDEIGHVSIGSRWFKYCCQLQDLEPERSFKQLVEKYFVGELRGPYHIEARRQAGFSEAELNYLQFHHE